MTQKNIIIVVIGLAVVLFLVFTVFQKDPRGAALFKANRCDECHIIKGAGGSAGPNLTRVGQRRSRQYITDQIKNPASHNPNTAMPSYANLPEQDINDLADYLSRLK